jgi:branched-chain amino acid transport system substrate-binding protein
MVRSLTHIGLSAAFGLALLGSAAAQDKVKVGLVLTLSGPPAALGQQAKNGFELAMKKLGGKLGGREAEVIVVDDELKPDVAVTKVKGLIDRDKVDFVVGPIFSNILGAIVKPLTDANTFLISPNAGSSALAGKACSPYFFATSYQNDQVHQISGKVAQDRGYKKLYLVAPNYQAGKDAIAGVKLDFKGEVLEESYVPLNLLDFQSELAKIASMKPDAVYAFLPGGMGVNFIKQYKQAGLAGRIPVLSSFTVDESTLPAQGEAALGMFAGSNWAADLDTPQNKAFVTEYVAAYNAVPATYAVQAYDAALLIDSALKATDGKTADKDAVRAALRKADFTSLRGPFKFSRNGYPVQDFYLTKVGKRPDGKFETQIVEKIFSNYADRYVAECTATN